MEKDYEKNGVLNAILSALIVGLDVVIAFIALGFIIGIYEILK